MKLNLLIFITIFGLAFDTYAKETKFLAQFEEVGEHYDPFADYAEFEEASEEEADVHFFTNGRLITAGGLLGTRKFTGNLGKSEKLFGVGGGAFLSFFFNLRAAVKLGYYRSAHTLVNQFEGIPKEEVVDISLSELFMDLRYYFNVQNVTRGLASINPYILLGTSKLTRKRTFNWSVDKEKSPAWGVNSGIGVEFPFMRNEAYFGVEFKFQYVGFEGENRNRRVDICGFINSNCQALEEDDTEEPSDIREVEHRPYGDMLNAILFIGFNF